MGGKQQGETIKTEVNTTQSKEIIFQIRVFSETAKLFPPLATYELDELRKSIESDGLKEPIKVLPDGRIIDGYHRWKILGDEVPYVILNLSDEEAIGLAIKLNRQRRQMSIEQRREFEATRREIGLKWRKVGKTQEQVARLLGVTQQAVAGWESISNTITCNPNIPDVRISIPRNDYLKITERLSRGETQEQVAADYDVNQSRISQIKTLVESRKDENRGASVPFPDGRFASIVLDPPWPITKIEREVVPNQGNHLDYSTMDLQEILDLPLRRIIDPVGCHIYLWVTQKFLPFGFTLFDRWGIKYQCLLTWVKSGGFTPFSFMYNTEHVLFGSVGDLPLLKKGIKLSFEGSVERHSQKPDTFYDIVRSASPEPRLEMFARKSREGFKVWGNEV